MKHTKPFVCATTLFSAIAIPAALSAPGDANLYTDSLPPRPVGGLSASPSVVATGTRPTLSWGIVYPSRVGTVADIVPPGMIVLREPMYLQVRAVGVGVTDSLSLDPMEQTPAEMRISINGTSYQQLFYGTNDDVDPTHSLYVKKLNAGTTINFGGRYVQDYSWTPFYTTRSSNMQVVTLVDGDRIPTSFDLNSSGRIAEFLKPYVNSDSTVNIGPLSMLVLAEYGSANHQSPAYDYQDMALLVTLSQKNNSGHGNNVDGVDSSNPGQGSGGPNGQIDPSAGVDDEK